MEFSSVKLLSQVKNRITCKTWFEADAECPLREGSTLYMYMYMYNRKKKIALFPVFSFFHANLQFLLKDRKGKTLVEEYDKYENTPLHVAAKKGYVRIVQVS